MADNWVTARIEIPSGTLQKWEVSKATGKLEWETKNGRPRVVNYLGYPGNYGMIEQTVWKKSAGGDGDPVDILVLGEPLPRDARVSVRIIGMLKVLDRNEGDHKVLAVPKTGPFSTITSLIALKRQYPGVMSIITTWFENYKHPDEVLVYGMLDCDETMRWIELHKN